jgi:hypothetical protein
VDEVRIYSGGYNGSADALPKSYESKMDETYPAPRTPSAGLVVYLPFLAVLIICGIAIFRSWK